MTTAHPHVHPHVHTQDPAPAGPADTADRRRAWIRPAAIGATVLAATAYTGVMNPNTSHAFPLCPLKAATDLDCPACGCLRAVHSLTRADVAGAANHNLLFVLSVPVILFAYVLLWRKALGHPVPTMVPGRALSAVLIVVVTVFTVARNVPGFPAHDFLNSAA